MEVDLEHNVPTDGQQVINGDLGLSAQSISHKEAQRSSPPPDEFTKVYLKGWRLHLVTVALCLSVFLPNFEISIVSTSLAAITNDLHGFSQSSWVITAYLITYTGLFIVWAKVSDIFGRKLTLIVALVIFISFSGACGAAQTRTQLIICRAFQGIGGSGLYALAMVIFFEMVPTSKYTIYAGLITVIFAVSLAIGPLAGGWINTHAAWRWVFLLNVPVGVLPLVLLIWVFPLRFPNHGKPSHLSKHRHHTGFATSIRKVDFLGATLLMGASLFLVTGLQETQNGRQWSSPLIVIMLTLSGPFWVAFLAWERRVTRADSVTEPVFPWRFMKSRVWMGMLMNTFLVGTVFTTCIIQIPLRLQAVNNLSTFDAGVRLLPYGVLVPFASFVAAAIIGKSKLPPQFVLVLGAAFQTIGISLMSKLPTSGDIRKAQYGYEVIAGMGTGLSLGTLVMLTPVVCEPRDLAVATAAINQFRFLGGSVGLAVVTSAMYSWAKSEFLQVLRIEQFNALMQTLDAVTDFSPETQHAVRIIFARGYNLQMRITIGFAASQLLTGLTIWQKKAVQLSQSN